MLTKRLKQQLEKKHLSVAALAKQAEVPAYFIHDILSGKSANPSPARLAQLARALEISLDYLIGNAASSATPAPLIIPSLHVINSGKKKGRLEDFIPDDAYGFQREWVVGRLKAAPENLRFVEVAADNMAPTLFARDKVLIDTSRTQPSPPGMFVLFDGLGLNVHRVERVGQKNLIRLSSDNQNYPPQERTLSQAEIVGRVVWYAREL